MLEDLMLLSYIKAQWFPYLAANPGMIDVYYIVLKLFLKHPRGSYRALVENGQLQAAAVVIHNYGYIWLGAFISAPYRVKGAGTKLMIRCAKEAIAIGTPRIQVSAACSAIGFYQKCGFVITTPSKYPYGETLMSLSEYNLHAFLERYS